ncbi:MAG: 2-oxo acid dehydrogenase subunit E2 [Inhella sp.]|uniref:2-oxo acid dehydrogenase subunit E2 n=1 Tax=Inhella sp. TaxID=1921806 RepID=UPI0022C156B9|nr:2-oxo acid dehydrogenase subunit E2 [Inhella sp.]MCZ8236572.1 2-oxo acid dehydrogenase subunit E2 [Inhella sp.]
MIELRLPSFGADMDDAEFLQWHVAPGEAVAKGAVVAVVETQKGAIDVEAWQPGVVARLVAQPGQRLPVGALLATLATEGEDWAAVAARPLPTAAAAPVPPPAATTPTTATTPTPASPPAATEAAEAAERVRATPAARRRAQALGVDLTTLRPAVPGGTLALADVERATAPAAGMRAAIAAAMVRSKREIPHYHVGREVEVEAALQWLATFNEARPLTERVLATVLLLKAVALALREVPELNGHWREGRFEPSGPIHLGVVSRLREGGLVVPTLHDADQQPLPALMQALDAALQRARQGRLRSSDLADSTVSVTPMGERGSDYVHGVIYPPQVALIGLGRVMARPVVHEGQLGVARVVQATVAADHRVSDGLRAARFLAAFQERLQQPESWA